MNRRDLKENKMAERFEGKVALVTGAGRNVGAETARRFADEGATVAVVDLDEERGRRTVSEIEQKHPGAARYFRCDVSNAEDVQALVGDVVQELGGIDVLVNNVAITDRGATVLDLEEDVWHRVLDVTLKSVFLCSKFVGRQMAEAGQGGAIINIGSTSGFHGRPNALVYGVAKAGVLNMSRSMANQLGTHGIRVNTVIPNKVGSPVGEEVEPEGRKRENLLGRGGQPADIAAAVTFLASEDAGFVTATDLLVDGGFFHGVR
jgi:NAD(P)-dependent dehydrogenase (short-subunit alcohol dehydrogenase family)